MATGTLAHDSVTISADPGLAVLVPDAATTDTVRAFLRARTAGPRAVGRLTFFGPEPGAPVRRGQVIARIDPTGGRLFRRRSFAQKEVAEANVGLAESGREKIRDAKAELADARAALLEARRKGRARFEDRMAEGRASERSLSRTVAGLSRTRSGLMGKLRRAQRSLASARTALAAAQALPDSDPTKAEKVAAAKALVARAKASAARLQAAIAKLDRGLDRARSGLARMRAGLAAGRAQFAEAMARMSAALDKMASARRALEERGRVLGHLAEAGRAFARAATHTDRAARSLTYRYELRSPIDGVLVSRRAEVGEPVFVGRPIAVVAPAGRLELRVHVPLGEVRGVLAGQRGEVSVDGVGTSFEAVVRRVRQAVRPAPTNLATRRTHLVYTVEVMLDVFDDTGTLKAGMPADVRIGS